MNYLRSILLLSFLTLACTSSFADYQIKSDDIRVDTSDFSGQLSENDTTVQKALDTLDEITVPAETDPVFSASEAHSINSADTTNWDTAYGWGDHAGLYLPIDSTPWEDEGYVTGTPWTSEGYAVTSNVLTLDNTTAFTPDANYEPATKKYVDDSVPSLTPYAKVDGSTDFTSEPAIQGIFTAGEALTAGDICYLKSSFGNLKAYKAKGDAEATIKGRILLANENISSGATGTFLIRGNRTDSGLTVAATYFVSTSTAGAKVTTAPTSGNFARVLGWANSTTSFYFNPSQDYVEVA